MNKAKVTLLSHTALPLETVYSIWELSKNEKALITPEQVRDTVPREEVLKLFRAVIAQRIPVGESVDFVFAIEGVSVSWREQAVRHRIGAKPSLERLGADIGAVDVQAFPDIADSVWWSQSMRIQNMGAFADNEGFRVPETLEGKTVNHFGVEQPAGDLYRGAMAAIQDAYNKLVAAGVPLEDARELMPLGATHRLSWKLNISALQHILGKRGCWILQLGIWGPVIEGMVEELATRVDPVFRELITPPCLKGDEFTGCIYHEENRRRYTGDDCHAPCSLHVAKHYLPDNLPDGEWPRPFTEAFGSRRAEASAANKSELEALGVPRASELVERAEKYRAFWGRDPYSGRRLRVIQ